MREQNEQLEEVVCEKKEIGLRCVIVHVCVLKSVWERERKIFSSKDIKSYGIDTICTKTQTSIIFPSRGCEGNEKKPS